MAVVDGPRVGELLFILCRPDGQMAQFPPSLDVSDIKAKADALGGIIVAIPVAFIYDGRNPNSKPRVPRPGNPQVDWPVTPVAVP